eukprot:941636-Ditylum_brightwellii.AAC.1
MSITRSSRTVTANGVKDLVGLTMDKLKMLNDDYLVSLLQDLALLDKDDVDALLGNDMETFLVGRKLSMIAFFLRKGKIVSSSTTMNVVIL